MQNISIHRYTYPKKVGYQGWIEPKDKSWIIFIRLDGDVKAYLNRDKKTGAVLF